MRIFCTPKQYKRMFQHSCYQKYLDNTIKNLATMKSIAFFALCCLALTEAFWSPEPTIHTCRASGDPHYYMFDGGVIHFQGICRYLLTGTCACSHMDPFHVYVENEHPDWSSSVSITKLVEIHIKSWIVQFNKWGIVNIRSTSGTWYYNIGVPYYLTVGTITKPSWNHMVFEARNGIRVEYKDNHYVTAQVPCTYEEELCGICGNLNYINDDYVTSSGVNVTGWPNMNTLIGNSWQVAPAAWSQLPRMCYMTVMVPPTVDFWPIIRDVNTDMCNMVREVAETCVRRFPERFEEFHDSCVYDVGAAGGEEGSHCATVQAFLDECEELTKEGYSEWRKQFKCPCPDGSYEDPCPRRFIGVIDEIPPITIQPIDDIHPITIRPIDDIRPITIRPIPPIGEVTIIPRQ